jgi:hypothetical protein
MLTSVRRQQCDADLQYQRSLHGRSVHVLVSMEPTTIFNRVKLPALDVKLFLAVWVGLG